MTCGDVTTGATSQAYCDNISSGCKYYSGGCYLKKACGSYAFPTGVSSDDDKILFC
jgi:hypothetical protein